MARVSDVGGQDFMPVHVSGRWSHLVQRLKKRGLVEVSKSHPQYDLLCALQAAIEKLLMDHPEARAKDNLGSEDFHQKIQFNIKSPSGKSYAFKSYANPLFASLRSGVGVNEKTFLGCMTTKTLPLLEFISNSRSGQDFYLSCDQRFILKTDRHACIKHLLSILRDYVEHFHTYPQSLLVKFLGLYSITSTTTKKKYFLVMQNIFYPNVFLEDRFDIKGCLANRYQNPNPSGKKTILILKDQNFLEEKLELG